MVKSFFKVAAFLLCSAPSLVQAGTLNLGDFSHWEWGNTMHSHDDGSTTSCRVQYAYFVSNLDSSKKPTFFNLYDYRRLLNEGSRYIAKDQMIQALRSYNPNMPDPHPAKNQDKSACQPKATPLS